MKQKEQVIVADVEPLVVGQNRPSVETQLGWYRLLYQARLLDEKARNYSKQSKGWGYHASHVGHDGIQLALGLAFRAGWPSLPADAGGILQCTQSVWDRSCRAVSDRSATI